MNMAAVPREGPDAMQQKRRSAGEMISTLCFAGVGLWLLGSALDASPVKGVALGACACACLAGAARHPLAAIVSRLRGDKTSDDGAARSGHRP